MNTDELRAAVGDAERLLKAIGPQEGYFEPIARALLHLHEQNAELRALVQADLAIMLDRDREIAEQTAALDDATAKLAKIAAENAELREEIDVLTGQHERDERENAELRRVLDSTMEELRGCYIAARRGESGEFSRMDADRLNEIMVFINSTEARRLLAGEVQDAAE